MPDKPSDLIQGTLEMLILKTLALEPMHGYGVALRIEQTSNGVFRVNPGSLFPALARLERAGRIKADGGIYEFEPMKPKGKATSAVRGSKPVERSPDASSSPTIASGGGGKSVETDPSGGQGCHCEVSAGTSLALRLEESAPERFGRLQPPDRQL